MKQMGTTLKGRADRMNLMMTMTTSFLSRTSQLLDAPKFMLIKILKYEGTDDPKKKIPQQV